MINQYNRKVRYYQLKVLQRKKVIDRKLDYIIEISNFYHIDPRLIYGILLIEQVNRGSWLVRIVERLFVNFFYKVVPMDISIGLAQIKISTAKNYLPNYSELEIAKLLLDEDWNIKISAKIIKSYYKTYGLKNNDDLIYLIKYYTTGNISTPASYSIKIYYLLFKWIIDCDLIRK